MITYHYSDSTFLPVYFSSKRHSDSRYFATKTVNGNLDKNSVIKNITTNEESKLKIFIII